jgi:hypothetical protein
MTITVSILCNELAGAQQNVALRLGTSRRISLGQLLIAI